MIKSLILFSLLFTGFLNLPPRLIKDTDTINSTLNLPAKNVDLTKINFIENSWSAAIKRASLEKKLIFVDAYTVWCAPCRQLKATTFKDKTAAEFFNKNFVNLSLDMEKGEGVKLSEKWGVEEFPTLIILDYKGNVITGNVGFMDPRDLIKLGQRALTKKKSGH